MRKILTAGLMMLSVAFAVPQNAFAQNPKKELRGEVRQKISEAIIAQTVTAIGLDPATEARFRAIIVKHAPAIEAAEQAQAQVRRELRQLVASRSTDGAALNRASDNLLAGRAAHQALTEARQHEIRALLTPQQFGMLLLEVPKIERQVRAQLLKAAGRGEGDEP